MRTYITFIAITLSISIMAQDLSKYGIDESKDAPSGLEVGKQAPAFEGKDVHSGEIIRLSNLLQKGPVVLIFYRGQWCPVCNKHLSNLEKSLDQIRDKGATVVAISPETQDNAQKTIDKTGLSSMVITDEDGSIMKDYKVDFDVTKGYETKIKTMLFTNIAKNNEQEEAQLPIPATYIISKAGTIRWRHFNPNYKERATAADILKHL